MANPEDCLNYDYVSLAWDIGFTFEEYNMKNEFDISVIGLVDVDKVTKDRDIPTVVKHIPTLLNFRLDSEMYKVLEPNFIKLFRLSQLAIQYLLFCKKYLDSTVALIKSEIMMVHDEKNDLESYLGVLKADNNTIKRKYEELKATLSTSTFKCEECAKTFYSEEYLLAHVRRRHGSVHNVQMQTEADKLQLEIKELKQRLNNTEKYILKDAKLTEDEENVVSPKESATDLKVEKEMDSCEPDNDNAVIENTIQYKFEQLKNHIETEINSLKDEDFYKGICEKYIQERVEQSLSVTTVPNSAALQPEIKKQDLQLTERKENSERNLTLNPKKSNETQTTSSNDTYVSAEENTPPKKDGLAAVESGTQTESWESQLVSEGTAMSPLTSPQKNGTASKPSEFGDNNLGDSESKTHSEVPTVNELYAQDLKALRSSNETNSSITRTIEEKLAKEAELQRETLEHILDLKLSGSLNKMEAQMTAFWQKLNAWESNMSFVKTTSAPSMNIQSEPLEIVRSVAENIMRRQTSAGSIDSNSPIHKMVAKELNVHKQPINVKEVPKALPRTAHLQKSPVIVVNSKAKKIIEVEDVKKMTPSQFLDSSDSESDSDSKTKSASQRVESPSEEEPSNIKPTESFKKRLDETLMQRFKVTVDSVDSVANHPVLRRVSERTNISKILSDYSIHPNDEVPSTSKSHNTYHNQQAEDSDDEQSEENTLEMRRRLKRHVEESVNQKLKDIGVSPHWKCLPEKSFNKAIEIVEHQANLSKKNINDFHKIRKNIERQIDKEIDNSQTANEKKRRATISLPVKNEKRLSSVGSSPPESDVVFVDIPLQRVAGRQSIKPNSRRGSINTESSITDSPSLKSKLKPIPSGSSSSESAAVPNHQFKYIQPNQRGNTVYTVESNLENKETESSSLLGTTTVTSCNTAFLGNKSSGAPTVAIAEGAPPLYVPKKKVLFNLDSDTTDHQSPVKLNQNFTNVANKKTNINAFMAQEKVNLSKDKRSNKAKRQSGVRSESESSDWDISDVT